MGNKKYISTGLLFIVFTSIFMFCCFYYRSFLTYLYLGMLAFVIPISFIISSQKLNLIKFSFCELIIKKFIYFLDKTDIILVFTKIHEILSLKLNVKQFLVLGVTVNFLCLIYCVAVKVFLFVDKSILISTDLHLYIYFFILFLGMCGLYFRLIISFTLTIMNTANRVLSECTGGDHGNESFTGKYTAKNFSRINNTINYFNHGPKSGLWTACTIGFGLCSLGVASFTGYQIWEQNKIARQNLNLLEYNSGIITKEEYMRSRRNNFSPVTGENKK